MHTHFEVSTVRGKRRWFYFVCPVQSKSFIYASTLCRTLDRLCDWILAYLRVYVCILCAWVCARCAVLITAQHSMCGRGSSHVLRPSAPLSILVGALACGGPARVTGKQQSASCERACSGKIPPVSPLHNGQCCAYKVPILFSPLVQETRRGSCTRAADDIHNENVLLGTAIVCGSLFGLCEQFQ